jgi:hypothetical protein
MAMVMIANEVGNKQTVESLADQGVRDDQDDHDGWGPIRVRRSSVPLELDTGLDMEMEKLSAKAHEPGCTPERRE